MTFVCCILLDIETEMCQFDENMFVHARSDPGMKFQFVYKIIFTENKCCEKFYIKLQKLPPVDDEIYITLLKFYI